MRGLDLSGGDDPPYYSAYMQGLAPFGLLRLLIKVGFVNDDAQ